MLIFESPLSSPAGGGWGRPPPLSPSALAVGCALGSTAHVCPGHCFQGNVCFPCLVGDRGPSPSSQSFLDLTVACVGERR